MNVHTKTKNTALKQKLLYTLLALLGLINLKAQVNLVPNGSFEELMNDSCNINSNDFNTTLKNWFVANRTPDVYNACTTGQSNSVPNNFTGFQYAQNGNGYIGILAFRLGANYIATPANSNLREWVGVKLTQKLTQGAIYCIENYYNLSNISALSTFSPQIYFSPDSITNDLNTLPDFNSFQNDHLVTFNFEPLSDTLNWVKYHNNYTALGDEKYLYIGNFYDYQTTVWDTFNPIPSGGGAAYYYVDNISIVKCGIATLDENIAHKNAVKIYPNPATNTVSIDIPKNYPNPQLYIYNLTGQLVATKPIQPNQPVPITELSAGMYIFSIQSNNTLIGRQRVVVY